MTNYIISEEKMSALKLELHPDIIRDISTHILEVALKADREQLRVITESDLHWSIGRIECIISHNRCLKSELEGVIPRLNRVVESLRGEP